MSETTDTNGAAKALARRALILTASLAMAGAALGILGALRGAVAGFEIVLVLSCVLTSFSLLVALLVFRNIPVQTVATAATVYFAIHLCASSIFAAVGAHDQLNLLIYLVWFFPLLVFNKLVNEPAVSRSLAKALLLTPLLLLCCLSWRLKAIFEIHLLFFFVAYCISYLAFGVMLDVVTRYREQYIVERERTESLKVESEILESISDCFISLDSDLRLVYLNDAACGEFAVDREAVLKQTIENAVPEFFSQSMLEWVQDASRNAAASVFEGQNKARDHWYELRCFPRRNGLSIYFRNITGATLARRKLDEANRGLRQQAELLDKAQDAILVQDMDSRIIYWNKSAERLYGWTAEEVTGRPLGDFFPDTIADMQKGFTCVLQHGEWGGELWQRHRDGSTLIVESRCTLVRGDDDGPRSILAIHTDVTNRKAAEARIHHLAFYDALTELPNRLLLRERLDKALETSAQRGSMGALFFLDLDDFKTLNDTLGHNNGDLLLQQVARRLPNCVRTGDTVARLGGDEFVVILEGLSEDAQRSGADAKLVADKILEAFRRPFQLGDYEYSCTVSIGITLFPGWRDSVDDLLKHADLAMYRAKAQSRNAICFFDPEMQAFAASRAALLSDLRRALQTHGFEVHYQPQVDRQRNVTGAEALLRWRHPRGGMVPPSEFVPLAEEAGLIFELGRWVLETSCEKLAQWATRPNMAGLSIAVNVSVRQFLDSSFVDVVEEVLRKSGANPRRLKLEITESSAMQNVADTIAKMTALRAHGVSFSLDDFGTGHSSLSHLKRLPLEQIKIDRTFIRDVLSDDKDTSIARTIITLGRNLNLSVIAEGVETEAQREFLEKEGCHAYQGYLFGKALAAPEFEALVEEGSLLRKGEIGGLLAIISRT